MLLLWPAFFVLGGVAAGVVATRLLGSSYSDPTMRYLLVILVGIPFLILGVWALVHARRVAKTLTMGIGYMVLRMSTGLTYVFLVYVVGLTLAWLFDIQFGH